MIIIFNPRAHDPNSLLAAEIVATQGVYSKVKIKNAKADNGVNRPCKAMPSPSMLVPVKTANVLTTASLADNPVIRLVAIRQSLNPNGLKIGAKNCPIKAKRLSLESVTTFKRKSNVCKNQMTKVAKKMTVNALIKKSLALSHIKCTTVFNEGKR